ncbi:hypothetical protein DL769_011093 [Monosporascus sp. CRB-8-3]|nr:hypothetical protein DL769_011093 [Monosporascus sp. CRB-8-3]
MHLDWTIPSDFNIAGADFKLVVEGSASDDDPLDVLAVSPGFRILVNANSSSTTPEPEKTPGPSNSTTMTGNTAISTGTMPTASGLSPEVTESELSIGAKAGIGVGVGTSAVFVVLGQLYFWRRRSRPAGLREMLEVRPYEKAELDWNSPQRAPGELDGEAEKSERHEADGTEIQPPQQEPVELAAETT